MAKQYEKPRLPKSAIPQHYDLRLMPDRSAGVFSGAVRMSVSVVSETNSVVLGAVGLTVNPKSVGFSSGNKVLKAVRVDLLAKQEMVVIEFAEKLPIGYGFLSMEFDGTLNPKVKGFLRSIFKNNNGEKKNMVETKFMPANASWCFPCWDEPNCKATLKITYEEGWVGGSVLLLGVAALICITAFRGMLRPPGGYWQEHFRFSGHPERVGHAVIAYTHPEVFAQHMVLSIVAFFAAWGVITVQLISWRVGEWVRLQMVLLWTAISSLLLAFVVFLFHMRPMVSALVWVCLVARGLYVIPKVWPVEEEVWVYGEEGEDEGVV